MVAIRFLNSNRISQNLNMNIGSICTSHLDKLHINKRHCFFQLLRATVAASSAAVAEHAFSMYVQMCMCAFFLMLPISKVSVNFSIPSALLCVFVFFWVQNETSTMAEWSSGPVHFVWKWIFNVTLRNEISSHFIRLHLVRIGLWAVSTEFVYVCVCRLFRV